MHGRLVLVLAAAALVAMLAEVPTAHAECCGTWYVFSLTFEAKRSRCADCGQPVSYYCGAAGGGGCNVFGCNCGGGCRQPIPGRTCSLNCCDKRQDRLDRRSRREVTRAAISTPAGNYTGHDVILAGDLDNDGHLDQVEVHLYLTQRGVFFDDVTDPWRQLDSNSDGRLTAAEIDTDLRSLNDVTAA